MSRIRANNIVNGAGTGAPTFPNGAIISGIATINADIDSNSNLTANQITSLQSIGVGTGATVTNPADNELAFNTNGSERLRIDSSGNIGINNTSPGSKLEIGDGTIDSSNFIRFGKRVAGTNSNRPVIGHHSDGSGSGIAICATSSGGKIHFFTGNGAAGFGSEFNEERMRIDQNGDVSIADGNLIFSTSGTGIDFSATGDGGTTTPNELLDDYEEGTWTPSFAGLTGASYSNQEGVYTKVGNLIYCECRMKLTDTGTASGGALQITGFPYDSSSSLVSRLGAYSFNYVTITGQDEGTLEASYFGSSTAVFNILENGHVSVLNTALTNTSQVDLMIVYRTL